MFGNEYARSFYSKFWTIHLIACTEIKASDLLAKQTVLDSLERLLTYFKNLFFRKSVSRYSPFTHANEGKRLRNLICIRKQDLFFFSIFPTSLSCRAESTSVSALVDCLFCHLIRVNSYFCFIITASQFNHIQRFRVFCVSGPTAITDVNFKVSKHWIKSDLDAPIAFFFVMQCL